MKRARSMDYDMKGVDERTVEEKDRAAMKQALSMELSHYSRCSIERKKGRRHVVSVLIEPDCSPHQTCTLQRAHGFNHVMVPAIIASCLISRPKNSQRYHCSSRWRRPNPQRNPSSPVFSSFDSSSEFLETPSGAGRTLSKRMMT